MLNLLKMRDGGRSSYEKYAAQVGPFLREVGGEVLYAGDCSTAVVAPDGHDWDAVLLVRYPSRAAFLAMVANPEYQTITGLRTSALENAVLQATVPWG